MHLQDNPVVKLALAIMLPIIVILALYTQAHGESSPGGGFQAGALLASACTAYIAAFGVKNLMIYTNMLRYLAVGGVGIYVGTGLISMVMGGKFLEYAVFATGHVGQQIGVFVVEIGVGMTVFAVLTLIILLFFAEVEDAGGN